ncbi:RNA polymerase sigma factor, partial [Anaerotignum sp.]|uniref:RNA polymerase sigma factor n=2 Tax=Clostridia TaxID=186801 RepID=UPI003A85086A
AKRVLNNDEDAEDAVQIAFLGIAQRIKSVPSDDPKKLRAYVLTAAKNAALSMLPKKQRRDNTFDISELVVVTGEDLFQQVMLSQDYDLLLRAMRQMPSPYREVLLMVCVQEQCVKDTAAILHRREGTVRQQLNRGKKLLVALCRKEGMCFEQKDNDAV